MTLTATTVSTPMKAAAFIASVIFLSWCFAGYRALQLAATPLHWFYFLAAVCATMVVLAVQGYWIYAEEKEKGTLRRKIAIFDRIYLWLQRNGKVEHKNG